MEANFKPETGYDLTGFLRAGSEPANPRLASPYHPSPAPAPQPPLSCVFSLDAVAMDIRVGLEMASTPGSGCLTHFWRYWTILWSRLASSANVSEFSEGKQRNRWVFFFRIGDNLSRRSGDGSTASCPDPERLLPLPSCLKKFHRAFFCEQTDFPTVFELDWT